LLETIEADKDRVIGIRFSPDSKILVSVGEDETAKIWSLDGSLLKILTGHKAIVSSVDFSPHGKTLATSSWDKTVILWNLDEWTLDVDALLDRGCNWLEDYLKHSPNVTEDDRQLCGVKAAPQVLE